ncbi:MAG: DUF3857 domain-containing protein [Mucilaginibacter sp.]|uniref:DUF3857 domain-containing protein n=1 Tax=Mucilaginibacter sp. TaxID=1882438 RepID=UPI0032670EE2
MRYTFLILLIAILAFTASAQQKYDVSQIPKDLLAHASAVIRNDETTIEVKDLNSVNGHYKQAVTVLNKNGDNVASLSIWHDKSRQIKNVKGFVYDEFGKLKSKISESDFQDGNVADGSLFDGTKIMRFHPTVNTYPYTVEYEYEVSSKQTLYFGDWYTGQSIGTSVEHSLYRFICKPDFKIHYKEINYPDQVKISDTLHTKTYTWLVSKLKALRYEPLSPEYDKLVSSVKITAEKFTYYGIPGSFTNWNEYGKWMYDNLLKSRHELPLETINRVKDLTKDITNPKQKAKLIYEYMQQKTRYVSVQVGIGGYQPFLAKDVDLVGYGDCKALVNYTQSLLSAVGIDSYYVEVKSGNTKISALPDFASISQSDHIILCVPFKNDTTWSDCTSQELPFGYLGNFTDDRNVVACTQEGGKFMHTPVLKSVDNKTIHNAKFILTNSGELKGEMITELEGSEYEERDYLLKESFKEQTKALKNTYPIENLEIESIILKQDKGIKPKTTETIKLQARDYINQNGNQLSFAPNTVSKYITPLKEVPNRKNPIYINRGYLDEDNISYTLPDGYSITTKPLTLTIDKPFGKYSTSTQIIGNKLIYKRSLQLNDGTFDKDMYTDLMDFYQTIYEADRYTLTLEKK